MRRTGIVIAFAAIAIAVWSGMRAINAEEARTLKGSIAYRERIALPPDAKAEVKLVDVSRADAPSVTIAEQTFPLTGSVPASFELTYDPARIVSGNRYALQARITADGQLMFITDQQWPVLDGQADKTDLLLVRVSQPAN